MLLENQSTAFLKAENMPEQRGEVVIYKAKDGQTLLEVRLENETVWLTQKQMAELFHRTVPNINIHLKSVFREKELDPKSTIKESLIVQTEGKRTITRRVELYNLDVIISIGYRVKSKRGTQFRIWATNVLRDHLVKGYTLYERRLQENKERLKELEAAIELVEQAKSVKGLSASESVGLLTVITEYTRSWLLLHQYDTGTLTTKQLRRDVRHRISESDAWKAISQLRETLMQKEEASELFGQEREKGILKGILAGIDQTFSGADLYPSTTGGK